MAPARIYLRFFEIVVAPLLAFTAVGGLNWLSFGNHLLDRPADQPAQQRATSAPALILDGYDLQPGRDIHYVMLAAHGIRAESHGTALRLRFETVRLALPEGKKPARYSGLSLFVYSRQQNRWRRLGSYLDDKIRGVLDPQQSVRLIEGWVAEVPGAGSQCQRVACQVRLVLGVRTGTNSTHGVNSAMAAITLSDTLDIRTTERGPSEYWDTYYQKAAMASRQRQYTEAERLYAEAIAFIESRHGPDHPAVAKILYNLALIDRKQGREPRFVERARQAYDLLDRHSDAEVQEALSPIVALLDKEQIARQLGDHFWDARNYAESYRYYRLAYEAAPGLATSDYNRNLKLAFDSAGVMKTACMLGREDEARAALEELRRRYGELEAETKKKLDYWLTSGGDFLARGRCRR